MHNQRRKGEKTLEWSKSNKYGIRDQGVFGWKYNMKYNIDYNTCQKRNKSIESELSTQP
jgi:hypothetical protein